MKDKNILLRILEEADIDELWVNFKDPFVGDHDKEGERFYICNYNAAIGDRKLSDCHFKVWAFFAPNMDSDEEEDVLSVYSQGRIITNDSGWVKEFESEKPILTLLYKKGVGMIG